MKNLIAVFAVLATPLYAGDIMVVDPFARVMRPNAPSGAAFMTLHNMGETDDRLIAVESAVAEVTQLHTHLLSDDGVMRMRHVEDGFEIKAGEMHMLARGGDHVMLMGLTGEINEGDEIPVTLIFEKAGEVEVMIPVDNVRGQDGHGGSDHSGHDMKKDDGS